MFKNYIKTAWRNLLKNRFYAIINIIGLTVGLAIGILILLWVQDELSFDNFHSKAKNIYQVNSYIGTGSSTQTTAYSPGPVAPFAKSEVSGVVNAVRVMESNDYAVFSHQNKVFKATSTAYTEPSFFKIFDFKLLQGNLQKPFPDDESVILTQSTAKKYFGTENPIGKTIEGDHKDRFTVSGIVQDFQQNSTIQFDMLFPLSIFAKQYNGQGAWKSLDEDWGNFNFKTYLELQPGLSAQNITHRLTQINLKNDRNAKPAAPNYEAYNLQQITKTHLYQPDGTPAGIQTVKIFLVVSLLILLIACINYVNLSTARSILRAKEVSIRKIIGAQKKQLLFQFIIESVMFFSISLVLAFVLIALLMPFYNQLSGKNMHFNLLDASVWKVILLTVVGTLLASSVYPSLLLISFEPIKALKGKLTLGIGNAAFRKVLVTTQFIFSVVLIICTLLIGLQLKYVREKDPGYQRDQVFTFMLRDTMYKHFDAVKTELRSQPGIVAMASGSKIVKNGNSTGGINWDGKDQNTTFIISTIGVDASFIPMMKLKLQSGTNFTGVKTDSAHYLLNETAVKMMGIKNPIGKRLKLQETEGTIIGILKDFNFASLKEAIKPAVVYYQPKNYRIYIKTTGKDAAKAIAAVGKVWKEYNPGFDFEYTFLDEDYTNLYQSDQRTGTLFNLFSAIAILISCLGLFGLATYTAQIMTKEIGIRKVLGASVGSIVTLVSKDFIRLIILAIIIASPLAYFTMEKWLQDFAYRIQIHWWVFALAGFVAIVIALITISFQSIKAALANPVKSLRSE